MANTTTITTITTFPIVTGGQRGVLATSILFSILPALAISLRVLSHRIAHRPLDASDYCAGAAAALSIALNATNVVAVLVDGLGYAHQDAIVEQFGWGPIYNINRLFVPWEFLWAVSLSFSKASILLLYCRLFPGSYMVLAARITIFLVLAWAVGTMVTGLLICRSLSTAGMVIPNRGCGDQVVYLFVSGAINLATDLTVLILPLAHLYRLRLPRPTKFGLIVVMSLGFFTCIISICRLIYISQLSFNDITWSLVPTVIFSILEPGMAATLSCVPLLKPLLPLFRRQKPSRVVITGNHLRAHRYDPAYADKLKLRPDRVEHTAEISADYGETSVVAVPKRSYDSVANIKGWDETTTEITVNKQWKVTREVGEWTQILGG